MSMSGVQIFLYWLDQLAPIYFFTALLASVLSFYVEHIGGLASRGKTRPTPPPQKLKKVDVVVPQDSGLPHFLYGASWSVPKRLFVVFYIAGALTLAVIYYASVSGQEVWPFSVASTAILLVHSIHVVRRIYECLYVHDFGKNSKMHVFFYFLAMLYYVMIPAALVDLPYDGKHIAVKSSHQEVTWAITATVTFGLWAQYQQYRHHILLANLRNKPSSHGSSLRSKATSTVDAYTIPMGGWFCAVACPHYTAEILLYVSYVLLIALDGRLQPDLAAPTILAVLHEFRFYSAFLFCFCNLLFAALASHVWYGQKFGDKYKSLHRKAMIPGIL